MKIAIGADHSGVLLKKEIINYLESNDIQVINKGTDTPDSVDYPDFALPVAKMVQNNEVNFGILICYTGIGMSMAANKVKGVRASLVGKVEDAILTREHNDSNVLCLSAKNTDVETALQIIKAYLESKFTGGRHCNRVDKVMKIETE